MNETSKSIIRRQYDIRFVNTYFKGNGIDIGSGNDSLNRFKYLFPLVNDIRSWDLSDGDAQYMHTIEDNVYDFVHSSHCLEHLRDPVESFKNWIRICRSGGHIIVTIPDEDLYEQGRFPSTFNADHKTSWTIMKYESWSPVSYNLLDFLFMFRSEIEVLKIELLNGSFQYNHSRYDQTYHNISESAIEFIVRKKLPEEITRKGRYAD